MVVTLVAGLLSVLVPFLPSPHDKDGWGVRLCRFREPGPYVVGESIWGVTFDAMLINFSQKTRECLPLTALGIRTEIAIGIVQPDKTYLHSLGRGGAERDPSVKPVRLAPGEFTSREFNFRQFLLVEVYQPGQHRVVARVDMGGQVFSSPPVVFDVVEALGDAVLTSYSVPLEGRELTLPADERERPVVQQIVVGNRVFLVYRRFNGKRWGGGTAGTFRLAELPSKVDMKVEGAYGDRRPLTIKYQDPNSRLGSVTLKINSISGSPWTDEDERLLQERLRPNDGLPNVAPAPRLVKS